MSKETLGIVLALVLGAVTLGLYLIDKSGKNTPTITLCVLLLISALSLCLVSMIPWLWTPKSTALKTWRVCSVTALVLLAVGRFGIWVWPQNSITETENTVKQPETGPPPFSVAIEATFFTPQRETVAGFYARYGGVLCPTNSSIFVRVVNLQPFPAMIAKYQVDMKNANGEWVRLIKLRTGSAAIYFGAAGPKQLWKVRETDMPFFDRVIQNLNLEPHDVVKGWILLEYPKEDNFYRFTPNFRVTIVDAAGVRYVSDVLTGDYTAAQNANLEMEVASSIDLSGLQQKYYGDWVKHPE